MREYGEGPGLRFLREFGDDAVPEAVPGVEPTLFAALSDLFVFGRSVLHVASDGTVTHVPLEDFDASGAEGAESVESVDKSREGFE